MFSSLPGRFNPELLFRPRSVAVIGAGEGVGAKVTANLLAGGFAGAVLPVGAGLDAVRGVLAYPDVARLPMAPDLAVIAVAEPAVEAAVRDLAARGTRAAVVVGGGAGLRALARETGLRMLGPYSFGLAVPGIGLDATRGHVAAAAGRVALVSQSPALCQAVLDWAGPNGVGFSHVVGIGGNDDIGFGLALDWLSRDPGTGAILLEVRRLKDPRAFLSAARAAARLRPVVALRAGLRLADPSGNADATFVAALRRCGVLCVRTFEDLLAAAETLTRARPARGEGLAIVTNGIGPGRLAADAALRNGLALAALTPETRAVISLRFPEAFGSAPGSDWPVYAGSGMSLGEGTALLAGAKEVGGVIVVHAPEGAGEAAGITALAAAAKAARPPVLACAMGETTGAAHRRFLAEAGVPAFATPELAVRGFLHLVEDRRNRAAARELPPSTVLALAPDRAEVARLFGRVREAGRDTLAQDEAMAVLACYGLATVPSRLVATAEEAVEAARALGYPVVLKHRRLVRPDPAARDSLALDLLDEAQLRAAAALLARHGQDGLLVQRQMGRARELRVQVGEDALFGPTIHFGQGGTAADALHDVAVDLPPLNLSLAQGMIAGTRVAATLGALRDQPAADIEAVADALVRVSQLVVDFPEIAELDVNPLFADAQGVAAADAWIRLRPPGMAARLSIPPYPAELTGQFDAKGQILTVRPIRPEDAQAHAAFFARLPPEDVRFRFFSAMRELSADQIARLTQVDYAREMAFIAVREPGETVGVARLVRETDSPEAEFAIAVQPDMKGTGLARHLMERLSQWGQAHGVSEIVGQVLADNMPMRAFVKRLGFVLHRVPGESDLVEARLALA